MTKAQPNTSDPLAHWRSNPALEVGGVWEELGEGVRWKISRMGGMNLETAERLSEFEQLADDASPTERWQRLALMYSEFVTAWEGMGDVECNSGEVYRVLLGHPDLVQRVTEVAQDADRFRDAAPRAADVGDKSGGELDEARATQRPGGTDGDRAGEARSRGRRPAASRFAVNADGRAPVPGNGVGHG